MKAKPITVIQTLPHMQELLLPQESVVYARSFSTDVLHFLHRIQIYQAKELTFSELIQLLTGKNAPNNILAEYATRSSLTFEKGEQVTTPLEWSVKGDIISVWLPGYSHPVRFEFFGETLEHAALIDESTQKQIAQIEHFIFPHYLPQDRGTLEELYILEPEKITPAVQRMLFTNQQATHIESAFPDISIKTISTDFTFPPLFYSHLGAFIKQLETLEKQGITVAIRTRHKQELVPALHKKLINNSWITTLAHKLEHSGFPRRSPKEHIYNIPAGFISKKLEVALFTDRELFGNLFLQKVKEKQHASKTIQRLLGQFEGEVAYGDYVVHEDYGVAQYKGISQEEANGITNEYLLLEFANKDELYVPLSQVEKITKYLSDASTPKKSKLSGGSWQRAKKKVRADTAALAKNLIAHFAKREISTALAVPEEDSERYKSFVADFPYEETPDQQTAIREVVHDLEQKTPMNRLLVGDVGFGKTEVAFRAAYKIMEAGGQVALLAPTTILTEQHAKVAKERFAHTPFTVAHVSRFNTTKENKKIIDSANNGGIQLLIGTHRILSSDVKFQNLQLVLVDEEQKFGVTQKEKLKRLNYGTHVLGISATPIPRTLSLALSSVQAISIITTPPKGRKPIETEIVYNNWQKVVNAIEREITRGGQVYVIHNRVRTIGSVVEKLKTYLPGISIAHAHGQMSAADLSRVMKKFHAHKFDVLVATSIVENGLDLSNVNTMIIHDSQQFGIAQLYQLRGRIGRGNKKAYCLLMAPKPRTKEKDIQKLLTENTLDPDSYRAAVQKQQKHKVYMQRLQALVENNHLGAGFTVASKDLEIRGAGNILGAKQHGHISQMGYALYVEMLAKEVEKQKAEIKTST